MKRIAQILVMVTITSASTLAATARRCVDCSGDGVGAFSFPFYLTVDVPAKLNGVGTTLPWTILGHNVPGSDYQSVLTLPQWTPVSGLHRLSTGGWLLSVAGPTSLGGTTWLPQDVLRYDPQAGSFTCFFTGSALGIPISSGIDALFLLGGDSGSLVLSFNTPTMIGGTIYQPADLVKFDPTGPACTGWSFSGAYFSASGAIPPVPPSTNVVAAGVFGRLTVLSFDAPTILGGQTFLPGDLVSWDGTTFSLFYRDPAWPLGARMNDVAF